MTPNELFSRLSTLYEARARLEEEAARLDREIALLLRKLPASLPPSQAGTLSLREAAEVLKVSYTTAYAMARQGRLPSVRVGRQYRVPVRALEEAMRAGGGPA